jgi:hypothetical protein
VNSNQQILYSVGFNIGLEDADIRVIEFSKSRDTVSVFNSNDAARQARGVYIINRVASKREVLLVLRDNNMEKYSILNTNI